MISALNFGRVFRTALATALVLGAQIASAQALSGAVDAGSVIRLTGPSLSGQSSGPFNGAVMSGPGAGSSFASFCIEQLETFNYNSNLYVQGVTTATTNSPTAGYGLLSTSDTLSYQTAWLFTQYSSGAYGNSATVNNAMQQAFWNLENEPGTPNSLAQSYIFDANTAVSNGYTGYGNVRVLNLYTDAGYTTHAQDQLVMLAPVPEPETYAMMLAGLGLMAVVARRRKQRQAA